MSAPIIAIWIGGVAASIALLVTLLDASDLMHADDADAVTLCCLNVMLICLLLILVGCARAVS